MNQQQKKNNNLFNKDVKISTISFFIFLNIVQNLSSEIFIKI